MSITNPSTTIASDEATFAIDRVFDAPRELVYRAWSEAERLAQWWGPKGMEIDVKSLDFTPNGLFHYSMGLPDGSKMWGRFIYKEIVPNERIVFVSSFSDAEAGITRAPFAENFPLETQSTITFTEEADGKTKLSLRGIPVNATAEEVEFFKGMNSSMQGGWTGTLDALEEFLAG